MKILKKMFCKKSAFHKISLKENYIQMKELEKPFVLELGMHVNFVLTLHSCYCFHGWKLSTTI